MEQNSNTQNENDSIDLWEIWAIVQKNARPILLTFGIVVLLAGLFTFFLIPKKYKSDITFYIQEKNTSGMLSTFAMQNLGGFLPMFGGGSTNADLCSQIVLAPSFLKRVLKEEKLPNNWQKVESFSKKVTVNKDQRSGAITISSIWKDPVISYKLTRRIYYNYKRFVDEQINHNNSENRVFIEGQYRNSKQRLKSAEDKLLEYEKSNDIPILPETTSIAINNFANLEQQRKSVQIGLNDAQHRLNEASSILDKRAPEVKDNVSDSVNPILTGYKAKISELEIELAKARETYTEEHPKVKALLKEKSELEHQIKSESDSLHAPTIAGSYLSALVEVAGLEARLDSLNKIYKEYYPKVTQIPVAMLTYGQLLREQKVAEQIYIMLNSQLEQAKISEAKDDNIVIQVIQPAIVPYKKYSPSVAKNMAVAGMLALFAGIGWAICKEFLGSSSTVHRHI